MKTLQTLFGTLLFATIAVTNVQAQSAEDLIFDGDGEINSSGNLILKGSKGIFLGGIIGGGDEAYLNINDDGFNLHSGWTARGKIRANNGLDVFSHANIKFRVNAPVPNQPFSTMKITGKAVGINIEDTPSSIGSVDLSSYKLFVNGGILTEEVRVRTDWADYVFDEGYSLKSLNEVENFIKENGHLPNVPAAATVAAEGVEVGDITRIQQEKIEELTLYIIEMNKKLEALQSKVTELERK